MITREDFEKYILQACSKDTSAHPNEWSPKNPFLGHCTLVTLLAQELFGGQILRISLHTVPDFEDVGWHSWNRFPDGSEFDFTKSQFTSPLPADLVPDVRTREELFSYPGIKDRYMLLKSRFIDLSDIEF